jgi:hypothetical protein
MQIRWHKGIIDLIYGRLFLFDPRNVHVLYIESSKDRGLVLEFGEGWARTSRYYISILGY